ncbi:DUF3240 family protein [Rhodoferax sp.]|uniref:DUF3240 family protein n=1 Tax=Rhodoferax sp. TaxID=50421 RepID=UPI002757220D|nr:DUF3240 family protein [Rhodoferax sp.]
MSKFCLALLCPPEIEEKLLDALLVHGGDEIFTSVPTFSHGTAHGRMDSVEQVIGRSRSVKVEIFVTEDEMARLLSALRASFAGTGLRFWAWPLAGEGEIE